MINQTVTDMVELSNDELGQVSGGLFDNNSGNVGVGEIDASTFGTYQPVNVGVGQVNIDDLTIAL